MSSLHEARLEGLVIGLMVTIIPYVLLEAARSRDIIPQRPGYFLQHAEIALAREKCKKQGYRDLFALGAVKLQDGRVRYEAMCTKDGSVITWLG